MDEDSNSWIRRTKFSHTVCRRLDPSKLASLPVGIRLDEFSRSKSIPESTGVSKRLGTLKPQIQTNPLTNKQRSVSPIPGTILDDTFKEARSDKKRFSTPISRRNTSDKERYKCSSSSGSSSPDLRPSSVKKSPNTSPLRRSLSPLRGFIKSKVKKDSSWSKYFDHGGGRVTSVESAEEHMVDLSQLLLGNRFARGAHSRLYHGVYKDERVAVKMICVPDDDENGTLAARLEKQFNREVTYLSRLHHPNVIRFVAACRQPPNYCILTEYLSEGSLRAYLHKLEHKTLSLQKIISVALDISHGMAYVHSRGVIHRDLKPENVLINEGFHMKIADFGIACEKVYRDAFAEDPGTYRWMAPEMIKDRSYGPKVDIYSFGLILWEMVSGWIPYEEMTPIQAAFAVVNKNLRPAFPTDCPEAMRALIEQCWSVQPDKRPEFWQIVKVLEEFESSLAHDGTLTLVHNSICQDHKGFLHWIQKLGPPNPNPESIPKP